MTGEGLAEAHIDLGEVSGRPLFDVKRQVAIRRVG